MSVAPHEEDEPSTCEPHGNDRPCWQCRQDQTNQISEDRFERRRYAA